MFIQVMIDGMNFTCHWKKECLCYTEGENATHECCKRGQASDICRNTLTGNDAKYKRCQLNHGKFARCFDEEKMEYLDYCRSCPRTTTRAMTTTTTTTTTSAPEVNAKPSYIVYWKNFSASINVFLSFYH